MNCDIIQDLLPLYYDDLCSNGTRAAVEEHLKTCETCRSTLAELDAPLPETARRQAAEDAAVVETLSKEWRRGKWRAWLKGVLIATALCAAAFAGWYGLTQWKFLPVDMTAYQLSEVAQLRDGRLTFRLTPQEGGVVPFSVWKKEGNGGCHLVSYRTVIPQSDEWLRDRDEYYLFDIAEENTWSKLHGDGTQITKIYLGSGEASILIWEEGMDLPPANAAQEAKYGYEPGSADYWAARG